jgi:hypothetical protein
MQIWLIILVNWPGARLAHQTNHLGVGGNDRLCLLEHGFVTAAHHRQLAVFRASLATRDWRVDETKSAIFCRGVKFARYFRRCGGVVDEDRALAHRAKRPVRANRYLAQIVVIADAGKHKVLAPCRFGRRFCKSAAMFLGPFFGLRGCAVVNGDLVPALVLQVCGHGVAHDAETKKCNFCHNVQSR